jgi:uncharacterized repeat protein (TIGR01451 family)
MRHNLLSFKLLLYPMTMLALHAAAASSDPVELPDHIPTKALKNAVLLHHVEPDTHVRVTFTLPLRNHKELQELIHRIHDPADDQYGKYLTPEEFTERFAPSQEDYDQVIAHAKNLGLTVHNLHRNRTLLNVGGPAHKVESAFDLELHHYSLPNGRKFYAPNRNPKVHSSIAPLISGIVGLHNHAKRRPYHHRKEMSHANAAPHMFPSGPGGGFAPNDLAIAYNLTGVSTRGTNQTIALFELADYLDSDINVYTETFGLPKAKLQRVPVDADEGSVAGMIDAEVTLDIELAIALAPESQIYVYEGPNTDQGVLDTYNQIATDNLAQQVSTSWGSGEDTVSAQTLQAEDRIFQQMAAQGQTIYAAAGDSGAYDDYPSTQSQTLVVDDPASQPFICGVGGTRLTVDATTGAYQNESVWNDGLGNGAGGGGVSTVWPIPAWQADVSTVYSKTNRNVPDVALNADTNTGYAIYYNGEWQIYGGTSCAAPLWAAFTACVNQELSATGHPALGLANPKLYALAGGSAYASDFHDVITGNNLFYSAETGYDNASGWGSFNGTNLYTSLTQAAPSFPVLNILMKHNAPFRKGQTGTFHIVISNNGNGSTSSAVTVAAFFSAGLLFHSFSGEGWTYDSTTMTFTQNHLLGPNESFPTLVLNVNVDRHAPHAVNTGASVSGGGSKTKNVSDEVTIR